MSRALVFPGQGTQKVGMGKAVADSYPIAREVFQEVDDALSIKLSDIIWGECQDTLNLTVNTQPALMAVSVAILRALESHGFSLQGVSYMAGHSLGEYTAHCVAGTFSLAETAKLLRIRGEAMQTAVPVGKGAMAAILGLDLKAAESVAQLASIHGICEVSNDNDPKQIVVSGEVSAVENAIQIAKDQGARRAVRLQTSAPFHCSLMKSATERMAQEFTEMTPGSANIPIVSNVTAEANPSKDHIDLLVKQITNRVRWRESVLWMQAQGVDSVVEIGIGNALSGMIRRTTPQIATSTCSTPDHIRKLAKENQEQFVV